MVQEILTYAIIFLALGITLYKTLQSFHIIGKKKPKSSSCSSCSSGACSSCSISDLQNKKSGLPVRVLHEEM